MAAASRTNASPALVPALARNPPPSPPAPEPTPSHPLPGSRVGTVRAIGPDSRFVLLEAAGPGSAPGVATGQELRCLHTDAAGASGPFALVRVSPERRPPFIVADVLSGQPQAGDDVYAVPSHHQAPPLGPAFTPSAASLLIPPAALPPTTR